MREITTLRELKNIVDRDKEQLQQQVESLIKQKDELIDQLDKKNDDIKLFFKEKKDMQQENFRLAEEI